jgi:hypothetical protein
MMNSSFFFASANARQTAFIAQSYEFKLPLLARRAGSGVLVFLLFAVAE